MTAIALGYRRHPLHERVPALRAALGEQPAGNGQLRRAPDFGSGHREVNSSDSGRENETFKAIHDSSSQSSGPRRLRLIEINWVARIALSIYSAAQSRPSPASVRRPPLSSRKR